MDEEYVWIVNQVDKEPYEEFWSGLHRVFKSRESAVKCIEDFESREYAIGLPYLLSPNIKKHRVWE
jgi:hypothetical protein